MSEQAGRYQRSFSGLVGALIVTLIAIAAFVAFRALTRDDLDVKPAPVDYLATVSVVQEAGDTVVYPPTLPDGWIATSANYRPGRDRTWGMGVLTPADAFVGLHQADASVEQLVEQYVDKDATEGAPVTLNSPLASSWRTFTDSGGDYALAAELDDDQTLVVFGNADQAEVRSFAESLVTTPVAQQ